MRASSAAFLAALPLVVAACHWPGFEGAQFQLILDPHDPNYPALIRHEDLPGGRLVVKWAELTARGLIGKPLSVAEERQPWASSFFPVWFGGAAGRWQDGAIRLTLRSLRGFEPPESGEAFELVKTASPALYGLSPLEKYDLAAGDYGMKAARFEAAARGHNIQGLVVGVPFWSGYCHGLAAAATLYREPRREVDVINPEGYRVRFHPKDVKALLGASYVFLGQRGWHVGAACHRRWHGTPECDDINPATLVLAVANRLGIAHSSFIIDIEPLEPVVNMALRRARIEQLGPPHAPAGRAPREVAQVLSVRIELEAASTQLPIADGGRRLDESGLFAPPEPSSKQLTYEAELALDRDGVLIGGRWADPDRGGPDFAWGVDGKLLWLNPSELLPGLVTDPNPHLDPKFVDRLASAAASSGSTRPTIRFEQ